MSSPESESPTAAAASPQTSTSTDDQSDTAAFVIVNRPYPYLARKNNNNNNIQGQNETAIETNTNTNMNIRKNSGRTFAASPDNIRVVGVRDLRRNRKNAGQHQNHNNDHAGPLRLDGDNGASYSDGDAAPSPPSSAPTSPSRGTRPLGATMPAAATANIASIMMTTTSSPTTKNGPSSPLQPSSSRTPSSARHRCVLQPHHNQHNNQFGVSSGVLHHRVVIGGGGANDENNDSNENSNNNNSNSSSNTNVHNMSQEERLKWWRNLSNILRIQRWVRRRLAKYRVARDADSRKIAMENIYRNESAETVQRAWRSFVACRSARDTAEILRQQQRQGQQRSAVTKTTK